MVVMMLELVELVEVQMEILGQEVLVGVKQVMERLTLAAVAVELQLTVVVEMVALV